MGFISPEFVPLPTRNLLKKYKREIPTDFEADAYKFGSGEAEIPYIFDLAARVLAEDEYEILMLCQVSGYKRREVAEIVQTA